MNPAYQVRLTLRQQSLPADYSEMNRRSTQTKWVFQELRYHGLLELIQSPTVATHTAI